LSKLCLARGGEILCPNFVKTLSKLCQNFVKTLSGPWRGNTLPNICQNFDNTLSKLCQNFVKTYHCHRGQKPTRLKLSQNFVKTLFFTKLCQNFVKTLSKLCQNFVKTLSEIHLSRTVARGPRHAPTNPQLYSPCTRSALCGGTSQATVAGCRSRCKMAPRQRGTPAGTIPAACPRTQPRCRLRGRAAAADVVRDLSAPPHGDPRRAGRRQRAREWPPRPWGAPGPAGKPDRGHGNPPPQASLPAASKRGAPNRYAPARNPTAAARPPKSPTTPARENPPCTRSAPAGKLKATTAIPRRKPAR